MGDRIQVKFIDEEKREVWFYSHWQGMAIEGAVKKAMARGKSRHDDPEYLARIIFCEMVSGEESELTGYGIGLAQHGDVDRVIVVDCSTQMVTLVNGDQIPFSKF